jgi:hypothetical protein
MSPLVEGIVIYLIGVGFGFYVGRVLWRERP